MELSYVNINVDREVYLVRDSHVGIGLSYAALVLFSLHTLSGIFLRENDPDPSKYLEIHQDENFDKLDIEDVLHSSQIGKTHNILQVQKIINMGTTQKAKTF